MKQLITILILISSIIANANNYTVSTVHAFNDLMKKVKPGDHIIWKNGTYADVKINFKPINKGTAKARIYLQAEVNGQVIFTGNSQLGISGEYLQVEGFTYKGTSTLASGENVISYADLYKQDHNSQHVRVTNCAIVDYTLADDQVENKWVVFYGAYNELDHVSLIGKKNQGATVVVNYFRSKNYVDGSDAAPSTYHSIHHNYFGWRTMPNDNGGEHIRVGDSKTSFTKGFNVVEHNFFEKHLLEPEVISNKSCDNIYRFNTFMGNDGALVLRHGNRCVVYGNYFDGTGSASSGGIRIIGDHHTVFNNYLENLTGGKASLKAPITIMSGVVGTALNGYYPANDAVVCYNTIVSSVGPVFRIGAANKGKEYNAPANLIIAENVVVNVTGKDDNAAVEEFMPSYKTVQNNVVAGGSALIKGFDKINSKYIVTAAGLRYLDAGKQSNKLVAVINERLTPFNLKVNDETAMKFNKEWVLKKSETGVNWKL